MPDTPENHDLIDKINALLPQTQCGQCGFKGCFPYAKAIALGLADINQCPPGGDQGIDDLADLLHVDRKTLFGPYKPPGVAFIVEQDCIGCVKCIAACPVDAIVGAAKLLHTVIATECTGCELCIAPCPVDCIIMQAAPLSDIPRAQKSSQAKRRYDARCLRKDNAEAEKILRAEQKKQQLKSNYQHKWG